jgi:uncharacterized protein
MQSAECYSKSSSTISIFTTYLVDAQYPTCYNSVRVHFYPIATFELIIVNNSNRPLRLNVGYMFNKAIGTSRDIPVEAEKIELEDLLIRNLRSVVRVSRTREGLLLQVRAEADVQTDCTRCLKEFYLPLSITFDELYQFPSRHREEKDLILPQDGYIDLKPLYREYFILETPIKRLCKPDCKGLCVVCGTNLNKATCEHHKKIKPATGIIEGEKTA